MKLAGLVSKTEVTGQTLIDKETLEEIYLRSSDISNSMVYLDTTNKLMHKNRGKASSKKSVSSRKNGNLGGRPPKEISDKKKRIQYLEDKSLIENRVLTEEERSEHVELLKAITAWEHSKKFKI